MTATRTRKPTLMQRLTTICSEYGWQVGRVRVPCDAPQSPPNTGVTTARYNAVMLWRDGCTEQLGWIWDVKKWTDEQVEERLKGLEVQG